MWCLELRHGGVVRETLSASQTPTLQRAPQVRVELAQVLTSPQGVSDLWIGFDSEGNEDWDNVVDGWGSVRVRFQDLASAALCAGVKSFLFVGDESEHLRDQNGVWHPPSKDAGSAKEASAPVEQRRAVSADSPTFIAANL